MSGQVYNLLSIVLAKSKFDRKAKINESGYANADLNFQISSDQPDETDPSRFNVSLLTELYLPNKGEAEVEIEVEIVGVFSRVDSEENLSMDYFSNVNAPAMIFPFLRQHIAHLTSLAALETILVPPVNFVKIYHDRLNRESNGEQ